MAVKPAINAEIEHLEMDVLTVYYIMNYYIYAIKQTC